MNHIKIPLSDRSLQRRPLDEGEERIKALWLEKFFKNLGRPADKAELLFANREAEKFALRKAAEIRKLVNPATNTPTLQ